MRAVLQRVTSASVTVDGEIVGAIDPTGRPGGQGLLAYVGVTHSDTPASADELARKIRSLRILDGERSASDVDAPILVISQFTLYGATAKGRRPSWTAAAPGAVAEPLVDRVVAALREQGTTVATGRFGAHMTVSSVGDGPITILVEV
ncbi:D-tyrosyl-tRNA(Tyr) deacylase [Rhodococcus rhodnii]|uniref:D-aminoacyl-tRNA deacylase n=2 Tax=Rhodococcus rhodnii TaxID=38312 RepID=R7WKX8_9NOCA|nr:D-aminoacyl-tRNA deacylase [Rhodococcus rhodnii]EOM74664.1 acid deacylase [Rhodococcus rhodnii LMG 5362]TXG90421.1 D-tyrosyl-tRNA(Tyr) deacylase [Rhodococcus rhodnii]